MRSPRRKGMPRNAVSGGWPSGRPPPGVAGRVVFNHRPSGGNGRAEKRFQITELIAVARAALVQPPGLVVPRDVCQGTGPQVGRAVPVVQHLADKPVLAPCQLEDGLEQAPESACVSVPARNPAWMSPIALSILFCSARCRADSSRAVMFLIEEPDAVAAVRLHHENTGHRDRRPGLVPAQVLLLIGSAVAGTDHGAELPQVLVVELRRRDVGEAPFESSS